MNSHIILRVVGKFLIPLIIIFGLYVHFHGDFGPGGGFQAGVIVAAGVILYALLFGLKACKQAVPPSWIRIGMTVGVLFYVGTGLVTWMLGGKFLDFDVLHPATDHPLGQHIGIIFVELGVLFTVATVMVAIFYAFGSRQPQIMDDEKDF
ncbi:Na(+)/H(+) antiporter subunit B [Robiginitomaculum antarcticum]|uniref:Na(+)/H(+) antiporter subunit B n=1 Tax=Robiginitomaculum antarcticum TaxID=437507 RepID=UPI000381F657|nr:Na(+)/H(+) antiporter subunit B [Robiginitomaculum antarcticum]